MAYPALSATVLRWRVQFSEACLRGGQLLLRLFELLLRDLQRDSKLFDDE
jgi:hypothetical protein